jgi:hypothetical protein
MLEMTAVRSTTGNYYGALRDDASDGTAETDIPDPSRSCGCPDCERDFAEYDRAFQDLGEDDQFFADGLLRTHGIVEALKYVRKKIWSPRPPRLDPAQRRICSFFPRRDGRARCWTCGGQHE